MNLIVYLCLGALIQCLQFCGAQKLENEKSAKVAGSPDNVWLDLQIIFEYNHVTPDGAQFPTEFANQYLQLSRDQLVEKLAQDDAATFSDLRSTVVEKKGAGDLVRMVLDASKFNKPMKEFEWHMTGDDVEDNYYLLTSHHLYSHRKLVSAILPFYSIIAVFGIYLFFNRKRLEQKESLKLTKTSRAVLSFLMFRLLYDLAYLAYLLVFQVMSKFQENGILFYAFLVSDQILDLAIFYGCITMFVQGYITLSNSKSLLYRRDSLVMTGLYFLSVTCVKIYMRIRNIELLEATLSKLVASLNNQEATVSYAMIFFTFSMRLAIVVLGARRFKDTYERYQKNTRFLQSIVVIAVAAALAIYIKFPLFANLTEIGTALKGELLGEGDFERVSDAISIPEIFQLLASCVLIYIWSGKGTNKKDEENFY